MLLKSASVCLGTDAVDVGVVSSGVSGSDGVDVDDGPVLARVWSAEQPTARKTQPAAASPMRARDTEVCT